MPRAVVLNSAGVTSTAGGTFADNSVALAGDSLSVANYNQGSAKVLEAWAIDSDSVAEIEWIYTRPEATHDQQHGFRCNIPSLLPGGAGVPKAHNVLPGYGTIDLYKSDVATISWTSTNLDDVLISWTTLYDDLPGVQGVFCSWPYIQQHQKSIVGIQCNAVASGTAAIYGAQRAINADDDRLHANTWYAILGISLSTAVTTVSLLGPDWGGQRIGTPGGVLDLRSDMWWVEQSVKWNLPLIPVFNSNNKGNVLVQIADCEASTAPKLDFTMYELDVPNTQTPSG